MARQNKTWQCNEIRVTGRTGNEKLWVGGGEIMSFRYVAVKHGFGDSVGYKPQHPRKITSTAIAMVRDVTCTGCKADCDGLQIR